MTKTRHLGKITAFDENHGLRDSQFPWLSTVPTI